MSGRALRKLPFLAHALFVKVSVLILVPQIEPGDESCCFVMRLVCPQTPTVTLERFLEAMTQAVDKQMEETANLVNAV